VYPTYEEAVPRIRMYITNSRANEDLAEWVKSKKLEVGFHVDEDLMMRSRFPLPDFMVTRHEFEERQENPEEPVLPKIDR